MRPTLSATLGLAAAACFALAASASAAPLSLTYHGASSGAERQTVTVTGAPVAYPGSGDWPRAVGAWGFKMRDASGRMTDFLAWCLDLASFVSTSASTGRAYAVTDTPFSGSYLDAAGRDRVQSVFDANFARVDATSGAQAAGFQLALWNAVYDADDDVMAGDFRAAADAATLSYANGYLGAASGYAGARRYDLAFLESTGGSGGKYQDLVTASPVPIPGAGGLMALAIGGIALASRRRRAA